MAAVNHACRPFGNTFVSRWAMPKIVDRDARRAEIAEAVMRVIARDGIEGASVRTIAAESGWSAGAVRHYFSSQDELLGFAADFVMRRIEGRLQAAIDDGAGPGRARVTHMLEQLLPLDVERIAESRVWIALLVRCSRDPGLDELRLRGWDGQRELCRMAVCELRGLPWPPSIGDADPDGGADAGAATDRAAAELHAFLDGLTLQAALVPERLTAGSARSALAAYLDRI